jgi:DNA/RNA-binding domain of Phe-tRNA-synthetase-like protein
MVDIEIDQNLKTACTGLTIGYLQCLVINQVKNQELWQEMDVLCQQIFKNMTIEELTNLTKIKLARATYKKLGKDPSRYRISSEALVRRILQGKDIYHINNIVDINNLISLKYLYSVGSYNLENLNFPIHFRIGKQGENYKGIGKEVISLENLPIFADTDGAFGSPTSDSERTMINLETRQLLMIVISFAGDEDIKDALNDAAIYFQKYTAAKEIETRIIK